MQRRIRLTQIYFNEGLLGCTNPIKLPTLTNNVFRQLAKLQLFNIVYILLRPDFYVDFTQFK